LPICQIVGKIALGSARRQFCSGIADDGAKTSGANQAQFPALARRAKRRNKHHLSGIEK